MIRRPARLVLLLVAAAVAPCLLALLPPAIVAAPSHKSDKREPAAAAREAISRSTRHALAAWLSSGEESSAMAALLHADFQQISPAGRIVRRRAGEGRPEWGVVTPQTLVTDDQREETMRLTAATSTIYRIVLPSAQEAIVTGEDVLCWAGRHGSDLRHDGPDGRVSVTPNTEVRTVHVRYRRYWVREGGGTGGTRWLLKRSRTLSERATAIL